MYLKTDQQIDLIVHLLNLNLQTGFTDLIGHLLIANHVLLYIYL